MRPHAQVGHGSDTFDRSRAELSWQWLVNLYASMGERELRILREALLLELRSGERDAAVFFCAERLAAINAVLDDEYE